MGKIFTPEKIWNAVVIAALGCGILKCGQGVYNLKVEKYDLELKVGTSQVFYNTHSTWSYEMKEITEKGDIFKYDLWSDLDELTPVYKTELQRVLIQDSEGQISLNAKSGRGSPLSVAGKEYYMKQDVFRKFGSRARHLVAEYYKQTGKLDWEAKKSQKILQDKARLESLLEESK